MNQRQKNNMIHYGLIKLNGIKEKLVDELKELEGMRNIINDTQRTKLESKISTRKVILKEILDIELEFREELKY